MRRAPADVKPIVSTHEATLLKRIEPHRPRSRFSDDPKMNHVATFMSPSPGALSDALIGQLARDLPNAGMPRWLDSGSAADIPFDLPLSFDARAIDAHLHESIAGLTVDVVIQPIAHRNKKLFVADMDSTMIGQECIDELADLIGLRDRVAAITASAMRGEIAFEPALRERIAMLRGLSVDGIMKVLAERVTLVPGARTLVQTMRAHGAYTALVSGGFTLFTRDIATMIGFHTDIANVLEVEDGKLTGLIREPVLGKSAKLDALESLSARLEIPLAETLAVGDGANDIAMLARAGLGVAFHAKPAVAAAAGARIDHCDLTALLYAQGYRSSYFCE
jgi:phosphoserine phosphatase